MDDEILDKRKRKFLKSNNFLKTDSINLIEERENFRLTLRSDKLNNFFNNRRKIISDLDPPNDEISDELYNLFKSTKNPFEKSNLILNHLNSNNYSSINYCVYMLNDLLKQDDDDDDSNIKYYEQIFSRDLINKLFSLLNLSAFEEFKIDVKNYNLLKNRVINIVSNLSYYDILTLNKLDEFHLKCLESLLNNENDFVIIDYVFLFFFNTFDNGKKFLTSINTNIFIMVLNFFINYHQNNKLSLDKYENVLYTGILIISDYIKFIDQIWLTESTIINSFNFLSSYLHVEKVRHLCLIGLYYITVKFDEIDLDSCVHREFVEYIFKLSNDHNYKLQYDCISMIIANLCASKSKQIVKKFIDYGIIKYLKIMFNSKEQSFVEKATLILSNIILNTVEEARMIMETGFLQKIVNYTISEPNNQLRRECVYILQATCGYHDLRLISSLVEFGILTAFIHVLKTSINYEEIECVLIALLCIFNHYGCNNEINIYQKKYIERFIDLNGKVYIEKHLYHKNAVSEIAELLMNKYFDQDIYRSDEDIYKNNNEFIYK